MSESKTNSNINDRKLVTKVSLALVCKIAIIACLGLAFFGSDTRVETDPQTVSQAILANTAAVSSAAEQKVS